MRKNICPDCHKRHRCLRPPRGFRCNLEPEHDGPCPAYARWWRKLELRLRTGVWWP